MTEQAFRQGLQVLAELGLSFDAWMYHTQLQELIDAARAVPDLTIVVDHLGGPVRIGPYKGNPSVSPEWRRALRGLAACENVYLKLGGIGMPLLGSPWHLKERPPTSIELSNFWRDDVDFCIDTFGPDRCMFESNFPIDREGCSYLVLWNAFKRITENRSASDKAQLFRGTAVRAYRLPDTPSRTGEISNHPTAVGMSFH
jgi:predicted TIM-barrel fold metal-dependent hydrolase